MIRLLRQFGAKTPRPARDNITVVVATPQWTLNGVNVFSVNLVRGLLSKGIPAHILLTEEDSRLVTVDHARMERAEDVPYRLLPVERWRSWGAHWGAMIRYLEKCAPSIYIPNYDWRHSCVSPLLSEKVGIIGIVHSDDPLHYDHVKRLGRYWNAIATTSETIACKTISLDPSLESRTVVIPIGVDIPEQPRAFVDRPGQPLRLIYPGTIRQQQKRVLDLPRIMRAAVALGVPVVLTVAGGGPDEENLKAASQDLVEQGLMRFLGVVDHDRVLNLVEQHDVFIMTSEFEGMPNALLEAMGRGCVPLVTDLESAIPELIQDGRGGLVVPIGAIELFAERLKLLHSNPALRREMAMKAYEAVSNPKFGVRAMVQSYIDLIERVFREAQSGVYKRPRGVLNHPPVQVAGVNLFPQTLPYEQRGVGRFPREVPDYEEFKGQSAKKPLSFLRKPRHRFRD